MKIEMHLHTSETSPCAAVPAAQVAEAYTEAGYDAIVVTDHFSRHVLRYYTGSPREKVAQYLSGYKLACRAARQTGLKVFFGTEVTLTSTGYNDYLIYGAEPEFLYEYPKLYRKSQRELFQICEYYNLLLFQAHPFRSYCTPQDPRWLHGAEVFNGNPGHSGKDNALAENWAANHNLLRSSGSDFHHMSGLGRGGILTDRSVSSEPELANALREGVELIRS